MLLASGCSSVVGGGGGSALMGEGVGWEGTTARGGMRVNMGGQMWVSSTSKNHPSYHKYKSPKQFELKQS